MNRQSLPCYATTLLLALGAPVQAHADSLKAKTGAWEMTTTSVTTGNLMPADALANMKPEQRARMEAAMKARSGVPKTHTSTTCVTQADLDQDRMLKQEADEAKCTKKVITKTSTKVALVKTCTAPGASTSTMVFEAKTPENIVGTIDMSRGDVDGKIHVDIVGRWLAASCAGVKDKD
jgi:Protein of unknown function (DUF3617)